jgi:hypothetical protein
MNVQNGHLKLMSNVAHFTQPCGGKTGHAGPFYHQLEETYLSVMWSQSSTLAPTKSLKKSTKKRTLVRLFAFVSQSYELGGVRWAIAIAIAHFTPRSSR